MEQPNKKIPDEKAPRKKYLSAASVANSDWRLHAVST
jgi:hypothetical protein